MRDQLFDIPAPRAGFLFLFKGRSPKNNVQNNVQNTVRLWGLIGFAFVTIVLLSACNTEADPPPDTEPVSAEQTTIAEPEEFPRTEEDLLGRSVTIAEAPQAIVSLAPSVTEMLFAVGAGPQVVGRTEYDNYPPEVESLPTIGGFSASSISVESILELEPDLVIAGDASQIELVETLEETGITVFVVQPETVDEILSTIRTVGAVTGHAAEAEALVAEMEARIAAVQDGVSDIPAGERVTVFYEVWHEPLMTTTNQTFIGELVELAGGQNIFGDLEETYPTISAEEIIELDPDVILGPSSHSDQLTVEIIAGRPGWENLSAVAGSAVFIVDGDIISRPGPRIVDALESIAADLYPGSFTDS